MVGEGQGVGKEMGWGGRWVGVRDWLGRKTS